MIMRALLLALLVLAGAPASAQSPTAPSSAPPISAPDTRGYTIGGGLIPVPDPTALTTQLVDRAISALEKKWDTQIRAIERAGELAHEDDMRSPTRIERTVGNLKDLVASWRDASDRVRDERFTRIDAQFLQSDKLREQLAIANSTAIAAALQAAEKAVAASNAERIAATAKSDAAFAEQLKTLQTIISTETKNLNDKVNDLKDRITQAQGVTLGARENKTDVQTNTTTLIALAIAAIAVLGLLMTHFSRRAHST